MMGRLERERVRRERAAEEERRELVGALFAFDTAHDLETAPIFDDPEPVFDEDAEFDPITPADVEPSELVVTSLVPARATLTLKAQSDDLVPQALALQVTDRDTCVAGELCFDALRAIEQGIHAHYDPHCDRAHKLWKGLTDERGGYLKPVEDARRVLGDRIAAWKLAEQQREQREQREREERARLEQQEATKRAAQQAVQSGDVNGAVEILAEARTLPAPIVPAAPTSVPSTGRTVTRATWIAEISDLPALLKAIGDRTLTEFDDAIREALQPLLNRQATVLKGELGKRYPGCEGRQRAKLAGR